MNSSVVNILNELLASEQRNIVTSLMESTMFVSRLSVRANDVLRRMARACQDHGSLLADTIQQQGGVPGIRLVDMAPADLHFQELGVALPRVLSDWQELITKYEIAQQQIQDSKVLAVLAKILEAHREAESSLLKLCEVESKTG